MRCVPTASSGRRKADGQPSFKLEDLARANGLLHEAAHDALSDVRATIALARLIRDRQPKLFDFAFGLRRKDRVAAEIGLPATRETARPFLHVSGMFPAERGCLAVDVAAGQPSDQQERDASPGTWPTTRASCAISTSTTLRLRLFTRTADLPEGVTRLPIKGDPPQQVADGRRQPEDAGAGDGARAGASTSTRALRHAAIARRAARHERDLAAGLRAAGAKARPTSTKTCTAASSATATGAA